MVGTKGTRWFMGAVLTFAFAADGEAATVDTVVQFDFQDSLGGFSEFVDTAALNVTVHPWTIVAGVIDSLSRAGTDKAVAGIGWEGGNSYTFTLVVEPTYQLNLYGYSFEENSEAMGSKKGPTGWALLINGDTSAAGTTSLNSFFERTGSLVLEGLKGGVDIQLHAYGGTDNGKHWYVDNFRLLGEVTPIPPPPPPPPPTPAPIPAAIWLLTSALAGLAFNTRIRRP